MLRKLFPSTRADLLNLFFNHPDDRFYMREVARLLNYDVSGIKRELDNLEKSGLLSSEKKGNLRYFFANKNSPLYSDFRNIIFKTTGIQGRLKAVFSTFTGVRLAFIYGSVARGREQRLSDVNLLVVGRIDLERLNESVRQLEQDLKREINYLVFDEADYRQKKQARDPFLRNILREPKMILVGREDEL